MPRPIEMEHRPRDRWWRADRYFTHITAVLKGFTKGGSSRRGEGERRREEEEETTDHSSTSTYSDARARVHTRVNSDKDDSSPITCTNHSTHAQLRS